MATLRTSHVTTFEITECPICHSYVYTYDMIREESGKAIHCIYCATKKTDKECICSSYTLEIRGCICGAYKQ